MIPAQFDYKAPATLDEAVALLASDLDGAKVLAGGHSLIPAMKLRFFIFIPLQLLRLPSEGLLSRCQRWILLRASRRANSPPTTTRAVTSGQ